LTVEEPELADEIVRTDTRDQKLVAVPVLVQYGDSAREEDVQAVADLTASL